MTQNNNDNLEHDTIWSNAKWIIKQSKKNAELYIANTNKTNRKEFYSYIT